MIVAASTPTEIPEMTRFDIETLPRVVSRYWNLDRADIWRQYAASLASPGGACLNSLPSFDAIRGGLRALTRQREHGALRVERLRDP